MRIPHPTDLPQIIRPEISYWRKIGGGSLGISLLIHGILLAIGIVWVLAVIPPPQPKPLTFDPGARGGNPVSNEKQQKRSETMKNLSSRIAAKNVSTSFTLPEPDSSSAISDLGALTGSPGNQFGSGPVGSGNPSLNNTGNFITPAGTGNVFGALSQEAPALIGTFYDLKQNPDRKPTGITTGKTQEVIKDFVTRGWKESALARDYFQAPQKLYQSKIYIPLMSADAAPAAFNCEKEVQPSRWLIVYRGTVTPKTDGKYRFVGAGDDVLVVRFNNKLMFDHGYYGGSTGTHLSGGTVQILNGSKKDREREKILRDSPMKLPVTFYQYDSIKNWNNAIGGLAVGPVFEAKAGVPYPIEILISEIPGGLFCSALMIQKEGETYDKASTGSPILPVFQVDQTPPAPSKGEAPPFANKAAPWKIVQGSHLDIDATQ